MDKESFLQAISQSIQESARQKRCSTGLPASYATREQALKQVAMLQAAKEATLGTC